MTNIQTTVVLIKPDAVERGLIGEVVTRIERSGLAIAAIKTMIPSASLIEQHYHEHVGREFYSDLMSLMTRSVVVAIAVRGQNAIAIMRKLRGATDPLTAAPGSITGDFGHVLAKGQNLVHCSSDPGAASRELSIWFESHEVLESSRCDALQVGESSD